MLVSLGNPLITTGDSHTSHSVLLVLISITSLPFVAIFNTVITPEKKAHLRLKYPQSFLDKEACGSMLLHPEIIADARTVMEIISVVRPHLVPASVCHW